MDDKFIMYLLSKIKCKSCGQQCEPENIDVLGHQDNTWLFYAYCPSCKHRGLVVVSTKEKEEDEKTEPADELTAEERNRLAIPLSSNDVIEMHIFLKTFSGDFFSLFAR